MTYFDTVRSPSLPDELRTVIEIKLPTAPRAARFLWGDALGTWQGNFRQGPKCSYGAMCVPNAAVRLRLYQHRSRLRCIAVIKSAIDAGALGATKEDPMAVFRQRFGRKREL